MTALQRHARAALLGAALALGLSAAVAGSPACGVEPDTRPLRLRLAETPLAFVGTVVSVDGGMLRFSVELALQGRPGRDVVRPAPTGPCEHRFRVGERWLYAGASLQQASRLLGSAALPLASHVARLDDRPLALSQWQHCDDSAQCLAVDNGCLLTAAHRDHRPEALERAWARGGDPRAISCAPGVRNDTVLACFDGRCGAWQVQAPPR